MNKKMLGGFSQFMSTATKDAAAADAAAVVQDTILNIDVDKLVPDPNNKYGMRDIDLLASMMEANQLHVETLEVRDIGEGMYMIVAGHRRCAAWKKLLESGVTEKRTLPCIVRKFSEIVITYSDDDSEQKTETMSSDYMAKVSLILSNLGQRKDKTLEEQIWEIKELEPYARALYASMKQKKEYKGAFRNFFAQEVLELSPVVLQRKLNLSRLSQNAQDALYQDKLISETAAVELSGMSPEEQDAYIDELRAGTATGRVQEVHDLKTGKSSDSESEPEDAPEDTVNNEGKKIKTIELEGFSNDSGLAAQVHIIESDGKYYSSYSYSEGTISGSYYPDSKIDHPYNTEDEAFQAAILLLAKDHSSFCKPLEKAGYMVPEQAPRSNSEPLPQELEQNDIDDAGPAIPFGNPLESVNSAPVQTPAAPAAPVHHGVVIPSIPVPNDGNVENANKEAHEWFDNSMVTVFNGLLEEAKHEQEAAQQAGNDAVAAQWGIRVAIANYRIVKLKEFVAKED